MLEGAGPAALTLHPGDQAVTMLAWDATDGRTVIPQLLIAPYAGADRVVVMTRGMDITSASEVAVTAWSASAAATG